jgi:hypothetical protein
MHLYLLLLSFLASSYALPTSTGTQPHEAQIERSPAHQSKPTHKVDESMKFRDERQRSKERDNYYTKNQKEYEKYRNRQREEGMRPVGREDFHTRRYGQHHLPSGKPVYGPQYGSDGHPIWAHDQIHSRPSPPPRHAKADNTHTRLQKVKQEAEASSSKIKHRIGKAGHAMARPNNNGKNYHSSTNTYYYGGYGARSSRSSSSGSDNEAEAEGDEGGSGGITKKSIGKAVGKWMCGMMGCGNDGDGDVSSSGHIVPKIIEAAVPDAETATKVVETATNAVGESCEDIASCCAGLLECCGGLLLEICASSSSK